MHSSRKYSNRPKRLHPSNINRNSRLRSAGRRLNKHQQEWSTPASHSAGSVEVCRPSNISLDSHLVRQTALAEVRDGNYSDAIALFDQLLEQDPLNATDYNNRGLVHFKCNNHEQALADYNTAIAIDEKLDSVYNNRANYYAYHGDLLGALLDYDMALDLNPYNVRAWINQGITFRDLAMYGRAIECFETALSFSNLESHIYLERGRTYHLRGDWNCAIADYQRTINHVIESCDQLGEKELRLLDQAEQWTDELLAPLTKR